MTNREPRAAPVPHTVAAISTLSRGTVPGPRCSTGASPPVRATGRRRRVGGHGLREARHDRSRRLRLCLGCMSYGVPDRGNHPWTLDEEESRPFIRRRSRPGSTSSTPRTSTPTAPARRSSAGRCATSPAATRSCIATKVHGPMRPGPNGGGLSRKAIMTEIDDSLRRLGTDYVDLYQIHRWDPRTPIEETLEALHDVVKAGKARYIGASFDVRVAVLQGAVHRRAARLDPVRHHAEPLQPALPRGGARDAAAVRRPGHRRHPVEPAGPRPAHPGLGRPPPRAARPTSSARPSTRTPTGRSSTPSRRSRTSAASPGPRSPWPGCCGSRR